MKTLTFSRASLDGEAIHSRIQEILSFLVLGYAPVYRCPEPGTMAHQVARTINEQPVTTWEVLTREDIARFQTALNVQMKLLTKVLPDLKAIEYTENTSRALLSDIELAQRISSMVGNAPRLTGATANTVTSLAPERTQ